MYTLIPRKPTYKSAHNQRAFEMLRAAAVTMLAITILINSIVIGSGDMPGRQWSVLLVPLIPIVTLALAYRTRLYAATWTFIVGLWMLITLSVVSFGGIRVQSFSVLVFILLLAFFLFEHNEWIVFLVLTLGTGTYAYFSSSLEQLARMQLSLNPNALFAEQVTLLITISALFYVAKRGYVEAVQRAEENRTQLERRSAELEKALAAQKQSEQRFRTLAESSPDALFIVNVDTMQIVDVNQNAINLLGYSENEMLSMTVIDLMPEKQSMPGLGRLPTGKIQQAMTGQTVVFEWDHKHANGQSVPTEVYLARFPSEEGNLVRASLHDITERKRAEKLLHQTDKMHSLGLLAGGVAHDFNNLLVALMGQTSIALAKLDVTHPATRHVTKAIDAAGRAAELTQQMLAFSGRGQLAMDEVDINQLLSSNFNLFASTLAKGIKIETDLREGLYAVRGDRSQLQQVLMNLIINAGEAIDSPSGTIFVETCMLTLTADDREFWKLTGEALEPGNYLSVSIRDTGKGMNAETLNHIFDPFYTTKSTGSGLGLAAVLGIIKGHQGGLVVRSEVGVGTEFHVVLPAVAFEDETHDETFYVEHAVEVQSTGRILVVDDQVDVRETARDILESYGYEVVLASDGEEGVLRFSETPHDYDLVLLDISMPGIDGEEAMALMREVDANVPVLLSSGYKRDGSGIGTVMTSRYTSFLQKPYSQHSLLDAVGEIIR